MNNGRTKLILSVGLQHRQRGLAAVESVIVLPVVLFVMLVVAEFGNAILQYNTLTQAVRDGAKYLAIEGEDGSSGVVDITAQDISDTANLVVYGAIGGGTPLLPGLNPADISVVDLGNGNISVSADYPYQPFFLGGVPNVAGGGSPGGVINLRAEVVMRVLL